MTKKNEKLNEIQSLLDTRYPNMPEFEQAVHDIAEDVIPYITESDDPQSLFDIFRYLVEPDRVINFRVNWLDDKNRRRSNRGFRVQFNNALGPYKGGLRFSESVNPSVLHFLGFEQIFKNSLTGLPMGGGKGGSDFDPSGKSDGEIERFCRAFMGQLARYIGPDIDVPAGDMGVGAREIAIMFDEYKSLTGMFNGVVTGKDPAFGGSKYRKEATGYGCVYFAEQALKEHDDKLAGKRCAVSGAGNVSQYTAEKLLEVDAQVVALSDRSGCVEFKDGMSAEALAEIKAHKAERGSLEELASQKDWTFHEKSKPWQQSCEIAFACATQNEIEESDAEALVAGDCGYVFEGANMPCTSAAVRSLRKGGVILGPAKAANAGGVAVSGLEIVQNRTAYGWSGDKVDDELKQIMHSIHEECKQAGQSDDSDSIDYKRGANVASFMKLSAAASLFGHG